MSTETVRTISDPGDYRDSAVRTISDLGEYSDSEDDIGPR